MRIELHDAHGVQLCTPAELSYLHGGYGQVLEGLERALQGRGACESSRSSATARA